MKPIFLEPFFQEKIWGGNQLKSQFNLEIPSNHTGEAWVISAHPNGVSKVKSPQEYAGMGLDELYDTHPELFGPEHPEPFPLLVKILDAHTELSVQVHPDDDYAKKHEGEKELGKTECWYIISADPGAKIIYGHNATTREEFDEMIKYEEWDELLREIPVKSGDFFDVAAGTIHAIGGGIMVLETQQSSDTTYRVYDYNRTNENGIKRELNIKEASQVTLFPHNDSAFTETTFSFNEGIQHLLTNDYFSVYKLTVSNSLNVQLPEDYYLFTVIDGTGSLIIDQKVYYLKSADSFILPYKKQDIEFTGNLELIMSKPEY